MSAPLLATVQSALHPQGAEAERVAALAAIMTIAGAAILLFVCICIALALRGGPRLRGVLRSERFLVGAGVVFPVVMLSVLLIGGLFLMRGNRELGQGEPVRVTVIGEQYWWRVVYGGEGGRAFETANELRIPVGRPVQLTLSTADVIHSFWAPALAGKLDMIPGRTNTLTLVATEAGISRGQCAEYCGGAHALMAFDIVALSEAEYESWFAAQSEPAAQPTGDRTFVGQSLFLAAGCGGCHTVRGTEAVGVIGPDLTHVGSRLSLAAATLPNDVASLSRWIRDSQHIKPENRMLPYGFLTEGQADVIAAYLTSLE